MEATIQALAEDVDELRYVSREEIAASIESWLSPGAHHRILIVHGPGGVGKSAVLRDAGRRAERQGYAVVSLDGRHLAEAASLEDELSRRVPDSSAPLTVLVDEIGALGAGLRSLGDWITGLPASSRVALAGRTEPGREWIDERLQALVVSRRLPPLTAEQSRTLLHRLDVDDPARVDAISDWAMGSPLALVVGAKAPEGALTEALASPDILDILVERIAGSALDGDERAALQAASVSWSVDEGLLAAALPGQDGARSLRRLAELDFVERVGERAAVHPMIAKAVVERMRADDPQLLRSLAMRVASHLRDRAVDGEAPALAELASLIRDPVLREGLGPASSERFYADRVRRSDFASLASRLEAGLWPLIEPWLRQSASVCLLARRRSGECAGVGVAFSSRAAVRVVDELSRPLLELAARLEQPERAVISPFQLAAADEPGENRADLTRFMNAIAVLRCGVANPRYDIVNAIGWSERDQEVAARYGYEELPELRRTVSGNEVRTWFADAGGGGLAGLVYDAIAAENGIEISAGDGWAELVADALESFHDDAALARLPVAPHGFDQSAAAAVVRNRVRSLVDRALAGEPELQAIIEARYLTTGRSHDAAMQATHHSRSSYYRKLRRAREAIAAAC